MCIRDSCKGMQVPYGQHPVMVQLHMGYISAFSHHQSMSDPVRIHSGAESGHNLFCLRFPTVRPIQMGKGILHLWLLYCRSSVDVYKRQVTEFTDTYRNPKILFAAVYPAIAIEPKEFTEDCNKAFDRLMTVL